MGQIKTAAIVVRRADYRENDRMLTLFSPTLGKLQVLARGCKRQNSPLRTASELFCTGEYVLFQKGEHAVVAGCTVSDFFYGLREDYDRLTHATYILELCAAAIQPEQENARLFYLLQQCLAHYCYGEQPPQRITEVFLMGLVSLLGFRPQVGRCVRCLKSLEGELSGEEGYIGAFDPEDGGVLCRSCAPGAKCRLTAKDALVLREIMHSGMKSLESPEGCSRDLFGALRQMAEYRMESEIRTGRLLD